MRLIDADAFDKVLKDAQLECKKNGGNFRYGVLATVRANLEKAPTVSGWISVKDRLPEAEQTVLVVKKLKNGRREYALARCIPDWETKDFVTGKVSVGPYWVCGGNNNVIMWTPLPEMPEE